jgi:hypothetical protein
VAVTHIERRPCLQCGSQDDLPHDSLAECLAANAKETRRLLRQSRVLLERRTRLIEQQAADAAGLREESRQIRRARRDVRRG